MNEMIHIKELRWIQEILKRTKLDGTSIRELSESGELYNIAKRESLKQYLENKSRRLDQVNSLNDSSSSSSSSSNSNTNPGPISRIKIDLLNDSSANLLNEFNLKDMKRDTDNAYLVHMTPPQRVKLGGIVSRYIGLDQDGAVEFETTSQTTEGKSYQQTVQMVDFPDAIEEVRSGELAIKDAINLSVFGDLKVYCSCVAAGTWIKTLLGSKRIEDIKPGDFVLSSDGNFYEVQELLESAPVKEAYKIQSVLSNRRNVLTSGVHPIMSRPYKDKKHRMIEASDLYAKVNKGKNRNKNDSPNCNVWKLPNPKPFHGADKEVEITKEEAFVLGCMAGTGFVTDVDCFYSRMSGLDVSEVDKNHRFIKKVYNGEQPCSPGSFLGVDNGVSAGIGATVSASAVSVNVSTGSVGVDKVEKEANKNGNDIEFDTIGIDHDSSIKKRLVLSVSRNWLRFVIDKIDVDFNLMPEKILEAPFCKKTYYYDLVYDSERLIELYTRFFIKVNPNTFDSSSNDSSFNDSFSDTNKNNTIKNNYKSDTFVFSPELFLISKSNKGYFLNGYAVANGKLLNRRDNCQIFMGCFNESVMYDLALMVHTLDITPSYGDKRQDVGDASLGIPFYVSFSFSTIYEVMEDLNENYGLFGGKEILKRKPQTNSENEIESIKKIIFDDSNSNNDNDSNDDSNSNDDSELNKTIELKKPIKFYDISLLSGPHDYVANGIIVSNCPAFLYWGAQYINWELDSGIEAENRFPHIRNPKLKGMLCKHLYQVMTVLPFNLSNIHRDVNSLFPDLKNQKGK